MLTPRGIATYTREQHWRIVGIKIGGGAHTFAHLKTSTATVNTPSHPSQVTLHGSDRLPRAHSSEQPPLGAGSAPRQLGPTITSPTRWEGDRTAGQRHIQRRAATSTATPNPTVTPTAHRHTATVPPHTTAIPPAPQPGVSDSYEAQACMLD